MLSAVPADGAKSVQDIKAEVIERFPLDRPGGHECRDILRDWFSRIQSRAGGKIERFELEAQRAAGVLEMVQRCFHNTPGAGRTPPRLWVWPDQDRLLTLLHQAPAQLELNMQSNRLDAALSRYFKQPSLQHDLIDASAINAMLYNELVSYARSRRSGLETGAIDWAYLFAGDKPLVENLLRVGGRSIAIFAQWILPPALGLFFFANRLAPAAVLIIAAWLLFVAYRVLRLPGWWRRRSGQRTAEQQADRILRGLTAAWLSSNGNTISPHRLKERVLEAEREGYVYPPALHVLIDRAVQRDPTALITV